MAKGVAKAVVQVRISPPQRAVAEIVRKEDVLGIVIKLYTLSCL
jgi:hypothetical protein